MKKLISILFCFFVLSLLLFVGCEQYNNVDNEMLIIGNKEYEIINSDWTPYGKTQFNGKYYLYENDPNTIFVKAKETALFDGIIYHNTDDVYPDISMRDKIDKIILETESKHIVVNDEIKELVLGELENISSYSNYKTSIADLSKSEFYLNVYYINYPAYQNEFMICFSTDNEPGVMYCETERNTNAFGKNKILLFSNKKLVTYINSLCT